MKKRGFTLIEVVLTIAVSAVTLITLFQIIFMVRNIYAGSGIKVKLLEKQLIINQKVNYDFNFKKILMIRKCSDTCLEFTFETGEVKELSYDRNKKIFSYGDYSTNLIGQSVFGNIKINAETIYETEFEENSILSIDIPIYNPEFEGEDFGFHLLYQYDPTKLSIDSINIVDNTSNDKEIYLIGGEEYTIFSSVEFSEPGYYLRNSDGSLEENSSEVIISGTVQNEPGTYNLIYSYKNELGEIVSTKKRTVIVLEGVIDFDYSGSCESFAIPVNGTYKFEVWGAEGGSSNEYSLGGKGAYTVGYKDMTINTTLNVCVGGAGSKGGTNDTAGGFNGGGTSLGASTGAGGSGGGATDIRITDSFDTTIIVAGGGGGSSSENDSLNASIGGAGGGKTGTYPTASYNGLGGTITGGVAATYTTSVTKLQKSGIKLYGGDSGLYSTSYSGGAGGGGYFGGGGGVRYGTGGGGSSYCGTMNNCVMYSGEDTFTLPNSNTGIGNSGNGYARITLINY